MRNPYVIVLGNEKGGTGKSTVSMHIISYLLKKKYTVASIDVDARQGTLTRYIQNRILQKENTDKEIPIPTHFNIMNSQLNSRSDAEQEDQTNFDKAIMDAADFDFIIIDTPGNDTYLSRYAHSHADLVVTPINDSFIDLDMLVRLDPKSKDIVKPSIYAENIWEQKKNKALRKRGSIDWVVLRNRKNATPGRGRSSIERILDTLAKRIGFRLVSGFSERIIFKELFLEGMTLSDVDPKTKKMQLAHVAARQELLELMAAILEPFNDRKIAV